MAEGYENKLPIEFGSWAEVKKHFESHISGTDIVDWAIYRFAEEFDAYPECHVFVAIDHAKEETIDAPWAVLLKSNCTEADDLEIVEIPLVTYGEDESDEDRDEDEEAGEDGEDDGELFEASSGDEDGSTDEDENGPKIPTVSCPGYQGHTVH